MMSGPTAERTRFNTTELAALRQLVDARRPQLVSLIDRLGKTPLTQDERERIREVLAEELCATGLGADDEPNARGVLIDRMIGRLRHY
jgi:hypothetical protein